MVGCLYLEASSTGSIYMEEEEEVNEFEDKILSVCPRPTNANVFSFCHRC